MAVKQILFLNLSILLLSCNLINSKKSNKNIVSLNNLQKETPAKKKTLLISKNRVLGKFDYRNDTLFVKVKKKYSSKTLFLNKKVYTAFIKMYNKAEKDGIVLKIISGTRNFTEQKRIWEQKWNRYKNNTPKERISKILEYSSMPSTSRHHWGTDIDMNNLNNNYFEKGKGKKIYDWLQLNANNFGFYQVYTSKKNGRTGYNLEKWHWSYLPLASQYLNYYNQHIKYKDINGFSGAKFAKSFRIISDYVNGIPSNLKNWK